MTEAGKPLDALRPWKYVDLRHQRNGQIRIFDEHYNHVANVLASAPNCEQTAARIVDAMNAAHAEAAPADDEIIEIDEDGKIVRGAHLAKLRASGHGEPAPRIPWKYSDAQLAERLGEPAPGLRERTIEECAQIAESRRGMRLEGHDPSKPHDTGFGIGHDMACYAIAQQIRAALTAPVPK